MLNLANSSQNRFRSLIYQRIFQYIFELLWKFLSKKVYFLILRKKQFQ